MGSPYAYVRSEESELERKMQGSVYWDDTDMLLSPRDGALVVCGMKHGVHCCQAEGCGKPVSFENGVEVTFGFARLLMHPGCIGRQKTSVSFFMSRIDGHIGRRELARAARASASIEKAAAESASRIIR